MALDLNRIRQLSLQNMSAGQAKPAEPAKQIVVDRNGNVKTGDSVAAGEAVTQVPQETFASKARIDREVAHASKYLPPPGPMLGRARGPNGENLWMVRIQTSTPTPARYDDPKPGNFEFCLYYDANEGGYVSQVVEPVLEAAWRNPHYGHLYPDGIICFGGSNGRTLPTLREAFAKSVLWAEGIAVMLASKEQGTAIQFPFSPNNSDDEAARV
jgi:hypothetical protein